MEFKRYQHVERWGNDEVDGIGVGTCYVFPKIDGSNSSVWAGDHGQICCGSRNRELSLEKDNQGFMAHVLADSALQSAVVDLGWRLYGEWLCPHSLKTYRKEAWRKFYVFDVTEETGDGFRYVPYEEYSIELFARRIECIDPLTVIENPSYDQLVSWLDRNNYLIEDGKGAGEGLVIKNYNYTNKYGRIVWAKIVTTEFKEKHTREMGAPNQKGKTQMEQKYAEEFVTEAVVSKVFSNIICEVSWSSGLIPRLLETVYHDVVVEDVWTFLKKNKFAALDFKVLRQFVYAKVKEVKPELF